MADHQKPERLTVNVPAPLIPLIKTRMETEQYASYSCYLLGLILFDLYCRRKHKMTAPLMSQPKWVRDKVIEQIVDDFTNDQRHGRAQEPGWFEKRLEELIRERHEQGKDQPPESKDDDEEDQPPKRPRK